MRGPTAYSLRDRTAEFLAIAERLQRQQVCTALLDCAMAALAAATMGGLKDAHGQRRAQQQGHPVQMEVGRAALSAECALHC